MNHETSPDAELRLPADSAYLAVLRTATAGLAARINFTLDDIEDLRIAVDEAFRARALVIKEERADLVKHHLWVLWTDYFKAPHFEKYPQLHQLFNEATKLAGGSGGAKASVDVAVADQLLAKIDEIATIFAETKQA